MQLKRGQVAVVITCFNQARFLADAIESVLAQTYPHVQVVVVDDGSQDGAAEVAARYPQVKYVWQENQDVSAARNTGLDSSAGEFQVFLDADDRFLPQAFEKGVAILRSHPELGFVAGRHVYVDSSGVYIGVPKEQLFVGRDHYAELLRANFIACPATVMFRRSVFDVVKGFDTRLNHAGDYDLYLRIARLFPIICHKEVIAEYRRHSANTSKNLKIMSEYTSKVLHAHLEQVKGTGRYEKACLKGIRFYERVFEIERLVAELRTHARANRWAKVVRGAFSLMQRHPLVVLQHAWRKLRLAFIGKNKAAAGENKGQWKYPMLRK